MKVAIKVLYVLGVFLCTQLQTSCTLAGKNEGSLKNTSAREEGGTTASNASSPEDDELPVLPDTGEACAAGERPFDYTEPIQAPVPASGSAGGGQKVMTSIAHFPLTLKFTLPGKQVYEPIPPGTRLMKFIKGDKKKLERKLISQQFRHIILDTEIVMDTRFDALAQNMQACDGSTLFHYSADPSKTKMCSNGFQLPEQETTTMFVRGDSPFAALLDSTAEGFVPTAEILRYVVNELKNATFQKTQHGLYLDAVPESFKTQFQKIKAQELEAAAQMGKKPAFPSFMVLRSAPFMSFNRAESICQLKDVQVFLKKPQVTCHRVSESMPGFAQWEGLKHDERIASLLAWVLGALLGEVEQKTPREDLARIEVVPQAGLGRFQQVVAERYKKIRGAAIDRAAEMASSKIQQPVRDLIQDKFLAQGITGFIQGYLGCQSTMIDNIIP